MSRGQHVYRVQRPSHFTLPGCRNGILEQRPIGKWPLRREQFQRSESLIKATVRQVDSRQGQPAFFHQRLLFRVIFGVIFRAIAGFGFHLPDQLRQSGDRRFTIAIGKLRHGGVVSKVMSQMALGSS